MDSIIKKDKQNPQSGFTLQFGGKNQNSSIQIERLSDPKITVCYNGSKKTLSLEELAKLLDL